MSKKALILESNDVPEYIKSIVARLHPVPSGYGDWFGYVFRLDAKWSCGYESQLQSDAEKLINWAKSWYAEAEIIDFKWWWKEVVHRENMPQGSREHRRKACRENWHNHALIWITDPVAYRFEKDGYYRNQKK